MRNQLAVIILVLGGALSAGCSVSVHGHRNDHQGQGVPQGQLPPPGMCRVWYSDRPAGHQPPPVTCSEARATAARTANARVIYGGDREERRRR
jgi:hypothetical protein